MINTCFYNNQKIFLIINFFNNFSSYSLFLIKYQYIIIFNIYIKIFIFKYYILVIVIFQ